MGPIRLVEKEYRVVYEESSVGHKLLYRAFETKGEDTLNLSKQLNVRQMCLQDERASTVTFS